MQSSLLIAADQGDLPVLVWWLRPQVVVIGIVAIVRGNQLVVLSLDIKFTDIPSRRNSENNHHGNRIKCVYRPFNTQEVRCF
jgi:hypothetical protein